MVTLGVATAIVAVVAAERVAELNRIGLRTALERRELTSRKQALGVGTGLDVLRADQDVSSARATIVTGDELLRKAREALGLGGRAARAGRRVTRDPDRRRHGRGRGRAMRALASRTSSERADIAAAQQRVVVAERNVAQRRALVPAHALRAEHARSTTADIGGGTPRTTWNISAVLSVPIWDGGARYGILRSARALREEAALQLESQRRAATVGLEQARRSISVAEAALEVAAQGGSSRPRSTG